MKRRKYARMVRAMIIDQALAEQLETVANAASVNCETAVNVMGTMKRIAEQLIRSCETLDAFLSSLGTMLGELHDHVMRIRDAAQTQPGGSKRAGTQIYNDLIDHLQGNEPVS